MKPLRQLLLVEDDGPPGGGATGTQTLERQPVVTQQQAATLPLPELRKLWRDATPASLSEGTPGSQQRGDAAGDTGGASDADAQAANRADTGDEGTDKQPAGDAATQTPTGGDGQQQPGVESELQKVRRQFDSLSGNNKTLSERNQQLEARLRELETAQRESQRTTEQQRLTAQHETFEERLKGLPGEQQAILRQAYRNQLHQAALNDYNQFVQGRESTVQQRELDLARREAPQLLGEILSYVGQQRSADAIDLNDAREFLTSDKAKALIDACQSPEALATVMATLSEQADWLVTRSVGQRAAEKEKRRLGAPPVTKDVPQGGRPAGGDAAIVDKINNMSAEEFAAYKKAQIRQANSVATVTR